MKTDNIVKVKNSLNELTIDCMVDSTNKIDLNGIKKLVDNIIENYIFSGKTIYFSYEGENESLDYYLKNLENELNNYMNNDDEI